MFKLVVLSALVAVAVAAPSVYHTPLAYSAVPSAVSHQSRTDVISKPVVTSYTAPAAVAYTAPVATYNAPAVAYSAPAVAYSAPAVAYSAPAVAVPTAVSHQSRTDVISKPVVASYTTYAAAAPAVHATYAAAPAVHATYAAAPAVAYSAPAVAYSAPAVGYGYAGYGYY